MPLSRRWFLSLVALVPIFTLSAAEPDTKPKKVLLVTHSGGFIHDSVGVAEEVLTALGVKEGFTVTTYRFTGDPAAKVKVKGKTKDDPETETNALEAYSKNFRSRTGKPVEPENCGRINKQMLKKFDCVFFFTTGDPVNKEELTDLLDWIKAGGAFVGTHCATDTLYSQPSYGDMIGGYFRTHPSGLQDVKLKFEDPKHPAAVGFTPDEIYKDEIYIFKDEPYSREKLHIILSAEGFMPKATPRKDSDYALAWCKDYGQGKVFYTAFGHQKQVWNDVKFQAHLIGGMKWAMGQAKGDATPTGKK
jgi:uncharacterized protein